jgi:hypothetical protein
MCPLFLAALDRKRERVYGQTKGKVNDRKKHLVAP